MGHANGMSRLQIVRPTSADIALAHELHDQSSPDATEHDLSAPRQDPAHETANDAMQDVMHEARLEGAPAPKRIGILIFRRFFACRSQFDFRSVFARQRDSRTVGCSRDQGWRDAGLCAAVFYRAMAAALPAVAPSHLDRKSRHTLDERLRCAVHCRRRGRTARETRHAVAAPLESSCAEDFLRCRQSAKARRFSRRTCRCRIARPTSRTPQRRPR